MKNNNQLWSNMKRFLVLGLTSLFLFSSCKNDFEKKKQEYQKLLLSAQTYNYLGEEEKALHYLDSLQLRIIREYSKNYPENKSFHYLNYIQDHV